MKWLQVSNPVGGLVLLTCLGLTLTVVLGRITWSLYQGFSPGRVEKELVKSSDESRREVSPESVLSGLPTTNKYQRLAVVKERIQELEAQEKAVKQELSKSLSSSSVGEPMKVYGEQKAIEQNLKILREEEYKVMVDIASDPSQ